jgi:hypothetical protein
MQFTHVFTAEGSNMSGIVLPFNRSAEETPYAQAAVATKVLFNHYIMITQR